MSKIPEEKRSNVYNRKSLSSVSPNYSTQSRVNTLNINFESYSEHTADARRHPPCFSYLLKKETVRRRSRLTASYLHSKTEAHPQFRRKSLYICNILIVSIFEFFVVRYSKTGILSNIYADDILVNYRRGSIIAPSSRTLLQCRGGGRTRLSDLRHSVNKRNPNPP